MLDDKELFKLKQELFIKTMETRNQIISNIDNQVTTIREVYVAFITILFSVYGVCQNMNLILLAGSVGLVFWFLEGTIKVNQRGYIFVNNQIQKEFNSVEATTIDSVFEQIIVRYACVTNGYKIFEGDKKEKYKNDTRLFHTLWMKNVYRFYLIISLCIFIFYFAFIFL